MLQRPAFELFFSIVLCAVVAVVPLQAIEPPYRRTTAPKDWNGFDRERLVQVLSGIATGADIPPAPLAVLPGGDILTPVPYLYRVQDGYNRFYGSVAAGFDSLPVIFPGFPADGAS